MVGKDGVAGVIYVGVYVAKFAAFELGGLESFKGNGLLLGRPDIFSALVQMTLGNFHSFGEVFMNVANGEQQPPNEVAGSDGFGPGGLDWASTHEVHPFDGLFGGW